MTQLVNILIAFLLMSAGFIIVALVYYMRNNNWNGYKNKQKMFVAGALLFLTATLLIYVPETSDLIKSLLTLDIDIDHSKRGFVVFGSIISLSLNMAYKKKPNGTDSGNQN
jgi:hypothetical protein